MSSGFFRAVYAVVERIPEGKVISYGRIADMIGAHGSARAVGYAMRCCPEDLPWHRVVRSDGGVTGGDWAELRRALLMSEGIPFDSSGRVLMEKCEWDG